MTRLHGIDLSHYQRDSLVPWTAVQQTSQFAIVKASDGTRKDPACADHVKRCRGLGLAVGIYHFFRDPVDVDAQLAVFGEQAYAVGLGAGDLLPCLDVEDYPGHKIGPHTSEPAEEWCERATNTWGGAIVYTSQRDWHRMGAPAWVLAYPLWIAHYPGKERPGPATPDHRPWRIWQYRVGPYAPGAWVNDFKAARAIDHNWAIDPLPLIAEPGQVSTEPEIEHHDPVYLTDVDWDELRAARDAAVREDS